MTVVAIKRPMVLKAEDLCSRNCVQEEGTSAGLDAEAGMSRTARTADEAERAKQTAEEFTPVTYNYAFFHFIFAVASMYLAMLMTGAHATSLQSLSLLQGQWCDTNRRMSGISTDAG